MQTIRRIIQRRRVGRRGRRAEQRSAIRDATGLSNRAPTPLRTAAAGLLGRRLARYGPGMDPVYAQEEIEIRTKGRGLVSIQKEVAATVRNAGVAVGQAHLFLLHTSAGLLITEPSSQRPFGCSICHTRSARRSGIGLGPVS